jgi:hypothetical protein
VNSVDLRYPQQTLMADYLRAAAGVVLCGAPLLLLEMNRWLAALLLLGFGLFALFLIRTGLRHQTRFVFSPDSLRAEGPAGTVVEWDRLDRMKLSYFSTKRDRSDGWMQLGVGSTGGRMVKVDSSLEGFHDIVARAADAAGATGVALSDATRANLRSMGIVVAGQEETV